MAELAEEHEVLCHEILFSCLLYDLYFGEDENAVYLDTDGVESLIADFLSHAIYFESFDCFLVDFF